MSFAALAAVSKMRCASAAEKLVALAYADRHNEETGCAYPSLAWLCEFSSLNRKTVIAAVIRLEKSGFITDTGDRQGNTRQIKVYRLNLESIPKPEQFQYRNSTEIGTVPKSAEKQSQKRDTDTVREPIPQKASPSSVARARKTSVPDDFWPECKPGSLTAKAMAAWPPGEVEAQIEHFIDYHRAHGTLSADWQASWRTWVKNWKSFNGHRNRPANDRRDEPANPMLAALQRRRAAEAGGGFSTGDRPALGYSR